MPVSPRAAVILLVLVTTSFLLQSSADARTRPAPQPSPFGSEVRFQCEVPVEAPADVQKRYEEHFGCVEAKVHAWLKAYPEDFARLEKLYSAYREGLRHDLRGSREASRYVRANPVDFSSQSVTLSDAQVKALAPSQSSNPALVEGNFQRLFVDRDNRRLFLTSDEIGLVSLSIAQRYAFNVEGKVGEAGATDFFVYDSRTAFVEEEVNKGEDRDLVVLDISDRAKPREVYRLRGAIPAVNPGGARVLTRIPTGPPTFEHYRMIQEGRVRLAGVCPSPNAGDIQCRLDRSCFRMEDRAEPGDLTCTRYVVPRPVPRRTMSTRGLPESSPTMSAAPREMARSAAPRGDIQGSAPVAEAMPQGGAGGAGSLSQMMVYGRTLYILSASHNQPRGWLSAFDVSRAQKPVVRQIVALDNGPEALQRHDNLLLIAGRDALVTASVAQPNAPRLLGEYRQNCPVNFDPVVVEGTIAYRTIIIDRPRSMCSSRLEVIDLSQPHQPVLRHTHPIARPRGLAVLSGALFVADENHGIQVFDLDDPVLPRHATTWNLPGVKDLVVSDFDLYAMSNDAIQTYYIAPLYRRGAKISVSAKNIEGVITVKRSKP